MNWTMIFELILGNLAEVVGSVVAIVLIFAVKTYVIPWLKEKRLFGIVKSLMAAAEAEFLEPGTGYLKKDWVFEQLDAMGIEYNAEIVGKFINGFTLELTAEGVLNNYAITDEMSEA